MNNKTDVDMSKAFLSCRSGAERRGIAFRLTYEEWCGLWLPHWERRKAEPLEMCRDGDSGAYELGNVRIDTRAANVEDLRTVARTGMEAAKAYAERHGTLPDRVERLERAAVRSALRATGDNVTHAAARLGITFRAMRYLIQRLT